MFRILLLSDLHERIPKISSFNREDYAAVVLAGDVTHGSLVFSRIDAFFQKLDFLGPFYYIPGNSDDPALSNTPLSNKSAICLDHQARACGDYEFLGVGGATRGILNQFAFTEREYRARIRSTCTLGRFDAAHQVLVTHDPPRNTCLDVNFHGHHVGSQVHGALWRKSNLFYCCQATFTSPGESKKSGKLRASMGSCKKRERSRNYD